MPTAKEPPINTVLVVGGGVIGLCCAMKLQSRGLRVTLVDPEPAHRGASWGNAGHIAIEQVDPLASRAMLRGLSKRLFWRGGALSLPWRDIGAWLPFSVRLLRATHPSRFAAGRSALSSLLAEAMPAWRRLVSEAGASHLLLEDGHFVVWESEATAKIGRAAWMSAAAGTAHFRDATAAELATIAALVTAPVAGAVRCIGSGQIADLNALHDVLGARFAGLGGVRRLASVKHLRFDDDMVSAVLDNGERFAADAIVVAGGAASAALLAPLGHRAPLIAERGYHIQSEGADWPADMPPTVFEDRSMIVTRFRSRLRASSFVEFGRAASPPDPRKWARLRSHVVALGLPFGEPASKWVGARPTLPDYLPAIGRSRRAPNLFYAFGHQHLGLTLGPVTGEAIAALVLGESPAQAMAPFDIERFDRVSIISPVKG